MTRLTPLRRTLLAAGVLGATLAWANCQLVFPADAPVRNKFFFGCYEGGITDPAGGGKVKLILEPDPADNRSNMTGCLEFDVGLGTELTTLAGAVEEVDELARLEGAAVGVRPEFTIRVTRQPAGQVDATTVEVANFIAAPFNLAEGLIRCAATTTCEELGLEVPFMPGGGTP